MQVRLQSLLFFVAAPLVASQCLIDDPSSLTDVILRQECSYDKLLSRINQARRVLIGSGVTNCLKKEEELAALLRLDPSNEDAIVAKVDSICDQAISRSRTDADYSVHFEDIPLIESTDAETIHRFLKEFYDGGELH